ncbi:Unknown protein, partial [Striga hermonthica]
PWVVKCTAQIEAEDSTKWSISRKEFKTLSVENTLLRIREGLLKGVELRWHDVTICCRDKELFNLISGKNRPAWSSVIVVEDMCSLLASFPICVVSFV